MATFESRDYPGMGREQSIQTLNAFLRAELSAVETYRLALARIASADRQAALRACLASHERRVEALRGQIRGLGGEPVDDAGPAAALARLGAGSAALRETDVVSLLEEGEDQGLELYLEDVGKLDHETRKRIERDILPEQIWTHDWLSELKLTLSAAQPAVI